MLGLSISPPTMCSMALSLSTPKMLPLIPVNFYGESKLKGEEIVLNTSADFAVLRLPILYGQVEKLSESAVLVLVNQLIDRRAQGVDHWAVRSPTSTADIAQAIDKMIAQHIEGAYRAGDLSL